MLSLVFGFLLSNFSSVPVQAEPWIANRYSQNCSACHSPNRNNVPLLERRCTLSCQGCHVNPSGGGMRNRYGAWNQNRFLRSYYWPKSFQNDYKMPAPIKEQLYYTKVKTAEQRDLELLKKAVKAKKDKEKGKDKKVAEKAERKKKSKMSLAEAVARGFPLVTTDNLDYDETIYDDKVDWRVTPDKNGFMRRLTEGDPFREEQDMHVYASGDFRYFFVNQSGDAAKAAFKDKWNNFLMSVDLDLRMRPMKRFLSLVIETRYLGSPTDPDVESSFINNNQVKTRSAYVLVDEIPFNTYFMGGIYRPMFGNYTPDHTALAQALSGFGQYTQYKAASIGTAPNVPFLYIHKVFPHESYAADPNPLRLNDALVVNLGGRFVTMGLSGMLSLWRGTYKKSDTGPELANNLTAISLGGYFMRKLVANFELLRVEREFAVGAKDAGVVYTAEFKYRFLRENYLTFNYASANIANTLKEGESSQISVGLRSMLYSGLELQFDYVMNHNSTVTPVATQDTNTMQFQTHLFF